MKITPRSFPAVFRWILLTNLVVIVLVLVLPRTVYAHDCLEDPLNAADCMRTAGYRQALVITFSTLPTISVIIPNLLQAPSNVLPPIIQSQLQPGTQPKVPPPEPVGPPPELVNEKGQVWYQPPWDKGGEYWVDRAEYDSIQEHLRMGYQWSDRWGWKPPEEIVQLDRQRDERWRKFTSKEEGMRRHQQLKRDIQRDLQNDPEYQRIQRELAAIKARLDEMKRKDLQEQIAYYQKQADYYNQQAEYYDRLYRGAKVVKAGADLAIDTLGMAPGAGRAVKYTYKFVSNTAQTSIEEQSLWEGVKKGSIETGKAYLGDKIGDNISIPGVDDPTRWDKLKAKQFFNKLVKSRYNQKQLIFNKYVDSKISQGMDQGEVAVQNLMK